MSLDVQPPAVRSVEDVDVERRAEQAYFDAALEVREAKRALRAGAGAAAGDRKAAHGLQVNHALDRTLGTPDEAVAFARLDTVSGDCLYVGKHAVLDTSSDVVVYPWQSEVIMRLREATAEDPRDLQRKREFRTAGNSIVSFEDLVLAEIAARLEALDDPDLAEIQGDQMLEDALSRERTPLMQDIVQTIQALQSRLIRTPLESLLVVQGGPGTGKTAVALHRVSWLLHHHRQQLRPQDVLVVGPNPTFTRYINRVLPELGDHQVVQTDVVGMLGLGVPARLKEDEAVAVLKGDDRMLEVLCRGLQDRIRPPQDEVAVTVSRVPWKLRIAPEDVARLVEGLRYEVYNVGRLRFRDMLTEEVHRLVQRRLAADGTVVASQLAGIRASQAEVDALADRVWPPMSAQAFLRDLLGSLERLLAASSGTLTAEEVQLLRRPTAARLSDERWSKEDLVLLDAVGAEMSGDADTFKHVVVDEAQDLTPMQLQAIRRRSARGSMTIVGDIAQSTGPWARDTWDDVIEALKSTMPVVREELTHGYRVPRAVMELAARLLPTAAPQVHAPTVIRDVTPGPRMIPVPEDDLATAVLSVVEQHSAKGRFIGVVCPGTRRADVQSAMDRYGIEWRNADDGSLGGSINLVSPVAAKGLEFDAVVVVDPEAIVEGGPQGLRMLYIALTRTTRYLDVVHPEHSLPRLLLDTPLPGGGEVDSAVSDTTSPQSPLAVGSRHEALPAATCLSPAQQRTVAFQATNVLEQLQETVPPELWRVVLEAALAHCDPLDQDGGA